MTKKAFNPGDWKKPRKKEILRCAQDDKKGRPERGLHKYKRTAKRIRERYAVMVSVLLPERLAAVPLAPSALIPTGCRRASPKIRRHAVAILRAAALPPHPTDT